MTRLALVAVAVLAQDLSGPVVRVIDGDTIEVELAGEVERVRYIGIDTPEMNDRRAAVRELAVEAKEANARLVEGRRVRLSSLALIGALAAGGSSSRHTAELSCTSSAADSP